MKSPAAHGRRWLVPLALACLAGGGAARADLPLPACVFYGEARDAYGMPYVHTAEVVLRVDGRECSRWPILGMLAPGVNFRLTLELDDGTGPSYAPYAARPGQPVTLSVRGPGGEQPILETQPLHAGQPGDLIEVRVTRGTDTDGDGLPDEWERFLIAGSGGILTGIAQVRPEDDFDGDGVSNLEEYLAGTYPFLRDDYVYVEDARLVGNQRLRLRFFTTAGFSYQVMASERLGAEAGWQPVAFAVSDGAPADRDALAGDGSYADVYVPLSLAHQFFVLQVR